MSWKIELSGTAERNLEKLDAQVTRRILKYLYERVSKLDDPRSLGEALKGSELGELWRYRVGDYRIIAQLEDNLLRVLIVRIGHRREIYR
jgi:mRNA interferase RelE/StbE